MIGENLPTAKRTGDADARLSDVRHSADGMIGPAHPRPRQPGVSRCLTAVGPRNIAFIRCVSAVSALIRVHLWPCLAIDDLRLATGD